MKLPNADRGIVPDRKITHYLLSTTHRDGQHKAAFFLSVGFTSEAGKTRFCAAAHAAPDGRNPNVRAVWFIANDGEIATLATAYLLDA